jgi:carboxypeptidase Taq
MGIDHQQVYKRLCDYLTETALLTSLEELVGWDERTNLPPAAGPYRAEQLTYLAKLVHQRRTHPCVAEWLEQLADSPLGADPHSECGATVRMARREYDKLVKMPSELVERLARTSVLGQQAWVRARENNDFGSFAPLLGEMVQLKQQQADAVGTTDCRYDALLDDYEPGETTENVARILAALREQLVPLIGRIADSERRPRTDLWERSYAIDQQEALGRQAAFDIGFDFQRGRLDVTDHPFCATMGPHDCRITTRYDENFFPGAFFGILHEAGHGIYEQGLPSEQFGLPTGTYSSLGIHESQSRLWENLVGRSHAFWRYYFPKAQASFTGSLADVKLEEFHFAINQVRPSVIRVEADEATYNLHIIVRFELEQALIDNQLAVSDLPDAWNEKYREYLGVVPENPADGVLQDIHWSAGLFGYFPTYALGNLYAAQFFAQAEEDVGPLESSFAAGDFRPLLAWLREHVHVHGQRYTAGELAEKTTQRPLQHAPLIDHLNTKLAPLYNLDR